MAGGTIGQLFVLFGIKTNLGQFKAANSALKQLKAAIALTGVVHLARDFIELAESTAKSAVHVLGMSSALGMSTKLIQQYSYVAQQAGSDINQFSVGISMFERNLKEFAAGRGSKRFIESMHAIGMTHAEAKADLAGPDGVNAAIFKVSDAYLKMGNTANRAAINTGLFGQRARGMAQDLGKGAAALKEQFAHLDAIGGIVSEEKLLALKKLDNAINDIKTAWHGVTGEIIGALAPAFTKMLEDVAHWIAENKKQIALVLNVAFDLISKVFRAIMWLTDFFASAMNGNIGAQAALITLAGLLLAVVVPALYAVAAAGFAAILPWLIPIAIIGLISIALLQLQAHWDEIAESFGDAWEVVQEKAAEFWHWLGLQLKAIGDWFQGVLHEALSGAEGILHSIANVARSVRDWAVGLWDGFWAGVDKVLNFFAEKAAWIKKTATEIKDLVVDQIEGIVAKGGIGSPLNVPGMPGYKPNINANAEPVQPAPFVGTVMQAIAVTQGNANTAMAPVADAFGQKPSTNQVAANAPAGSAGALAAAADHVVKPMNVSVGPTTINITGVKDASESKDHIADSMDGVLRHAAAGLGGEVQ